MRKILRFVVAEYKKMLPPTLFFLIVFHVTAFNRGLMEETYGITPSGSAVATVGALIIGKVILVVNRLGFVNRFVNRPLVLSILWKTVIFGIIGSAFQLIEEGVPLVVKYHSIPVAACNLVGEIVWPKFLANHILLLVWLLIYCTAVELIRVFGLERLRTVFFGPRRGTGNRADQEAFDPDI